LLSALAAVGLKWSEVTDLVHGTTMVTNAIVEGRLAKVALIATKGFADTLAIGRQNRRHLYRLDLPPKLMPLVSAEGRFEVDERLDHHGRVICPLADHDIDAAIERAMATGAEAVAVSLIHSYANPAHEDRIGDRLRKRLPYVALSNRVNPEAREYERTATTVLSASIMPIAAGYLDELIAQKPMSSRLHLFQSAGDMASPESLRDLPLGLAMSGPAAGVMAAAQVSRLLGLKHAISFDMGGTTTDVCLIASGRPEIATDRSLNDRPLRQPMVAVETIGAGGGSIARLDHGALCVGPDSAGADPGPACYGRGGTRPSVTDADLVLGYLSCERLFGNELRLDAVAARTAIGELAAQAGMSVVQTALGIVAVANQAMVRALHRVTVERGIDGRQCTLVAFGGAGPMHAAAVAVAFGIAQVIVPAASSVFSALGCVGADMGYSQQRSVRVPGDAWDLDRLDHVLGELRARLAAPLLAAGYAEDQLQIERAAAVRFRGQSYSVEIINPDLTDAEDLGRRFMDRHRVLYGFATDEPWELVSLRMRVWAPRDASNAPIKLARDNGQRLISVDRCVFDHRGELDTDRLDRSSLVPGNSISGPAIVEDAFSTVVVPPGATLTPDQNGHLFINIRAA
jgi:N-methylhydantoinase A